MLIGNYFAQALLPSSLLIGNYSTITPAYRVVWYIVEADVNILKSQTYCFQLAVLLTTYYGSH